MTKIQLISGFLGTGKTTFLKRFISYLKKSNKKICVLEFDFGAINVDTLILYNYDNQIDIESITVNNDHDSYLRRLKTIKTIQIIHESLGKIYSKLNGVP